MSPGLGRTRSVALSGLDGTVVDVEAHISQGLPHFSVGGMPDAACAQSPDRVRSAAANSGVPVSPNRVTVNLSPASIPKRGPSSFKPAILWNGIRTSVPPHISPGTRVVVNTADGSYVERAKD